MNDSLIITIADLTGVAVFAASGATAAVSKRLDLFGVCVIGALTALGGGMIRDIVIGATPPLFFADWRYPVTAILVASLVFWLHPAVNRMRITMLVLDAAGLALFTVIGTHKALDYGVPVLGACFIGVISGVGGGILRDLLTREIPVVLQRDFYALASLIGAVIVVAGQNLTDDTARMIVAFLGAATVFFVRLVALKYAWHAPKPRFRNPYEDLYPGFVPLLGPRGFNAPFSSQAIVLSSQCPFSGIEKQRKVDTYGYGQRHQPAIPPHFQHRQSFSYVRTRFRYHPSHSFYSHIFGRLSPCLPERDWQAPPLDGPRRG